MDVGFIHLRDKKPNGGIHTTGGLTLAYSQVNPGTLALAISMCSEKDTFCRRIGRLISGGRLKKGMYAHTIALDATHQYSGKELAQLVHAHIQNGQK